MNRFFFLPIIIISVIVLFSSTPNHEAYASQCLFNFAGNSGTANFGTPLFGNLWTSGTCTVGTGKTITSVSLNVTTASGNVRIKIYAAPPDSFTLLKEFGPFPVSGTGVQSFPVNFVDPVGGGNVYGVFETDSNLLALRYDAGAGAFFKAHTYGPGPATVIGPTGWDPWWEKITFFNLGTLSVTPSTGTVGSSVFLNGSGFGTTKTVTIKFDGTTLGTATTYANGIGTDSHFNFTFNVPVGVAGTHTINATDNNVPPFSANGTYTIIPSVLLSPSSGTVRTSENSLGNGFAANSAFNIKFDGVILPTTPGSPKTDHLGQFNNTLFTIPNTFSGIHTIRVTDASGNFKDIPYSVTSSSGFSLSYTSLTLSSIGLSWLTPTVIGGETIKGYQINYTTPNGVPQTVIFNNTASTSTTLTLSGLLPSTQYSFRVGVWTNGTTNKNMTNILDVTTLTNSSSPSSGVPPATPPNLTIGNLNFNPGTNPSHIGFQFFRQNTNTTLTDLFVGFPTTYNPTCNLNYEFANVNKTYSSLATTSNGTGRVKADFQFFNLGSEVVNVKCRDINSNDTGRYTLTNSISSIPLVQQVQNFENGVYGTAGQFGAFDLIELIVIIISMIALNRVDERVGAIVMIFVLAGLAYFHIGSFSVIIFGALAVVILLIVGTGRKLAITP